ncbi:MAG TPA: SDR family oxidoreductase [Ramlibacter sp.]|jgi:NAD(P)-dependent dehydrogenase (short-subunit alcohol dehydrogenase family)|nr:SDR family oxidoreductase [Ramlibacter sp.]
MGAQRFSLDGKLIAMTGAAGILGQGAVAAFLEAGARVCALDRTEADLQRLGTHERLLAIPTDVSDAASVRAAADRLDATWGVADVLFNNAATKSENFFAPFEDFPLEDWNAVLAVNLTGAMLCAQAFGAPMARRGRGAIVNTLSIYGIVAPDQRIYEGSEYLGRPINTPAIYSASKAGLWGLTQYLASYWGGRGVRVNAITPGGVFSGQNETFVGNYSQRVPLGRMATREDIVNGMVFLASDASSYLNGHNLVVDGGWTVW